MCYEDIFYGRIDQNGIAVYPSETVLKQVVSSKTIYNINFVVDAWEDFRIHIRRLIADGSIKRSSVYVNLEPQAGWESVHSAYNEWNNNLYQLFSGKFMDSPRSRKIIDFKSFIDVYLEFIDKTTRFFPNTRESYILSRMCSPHISGLIIEVAELSYATDSVKDRYLKDESYNKVIQTAKRYGFKIDKNAPWRFIADLESNKMKEYMKEYAYSVEDAFNETYYKSYENDLNVFKYYVWAWYDQFTEFFPYVEELVHKTSPVQTLFDNKSCNGKTITLKAKREILTQEQAFEKFSDEFWVRLYAYVRAKEAQKRWRQPKFDKVVKKTLDLMRIKENNSEALEYLYGEIETPGKKQLELKKSFTKEQIDGILIEKGLNKRKATFNF
jgi:hypothetical protein